MKKLFLPVMALGVAVYACNRGNDSNLPGPIGPEQLKAYSKTPSLITTLDAAAGVKIFPLISSADVLEQSPGFVYGAQPDGGGFMKDPAGDGFIMINNHEINQSVSRVYLNKHLKPVKGEYILNFTGGAKRLCSATLATPETHGFGPLFLTAQESGTESQVLAIDPLGTTANAGKQEQLLPALGHASMENAVPLPKAAYAGKTVIFMGEDQGFDAVNNSAGQLIMYVSDKVGDLENGKLYVLKRKDNNQVETDMKTGSSYDVEFVEIPGAKGLTGVQINAAVNDLKAIRFSRVEDVDYGKGSARNNREVYFTATGQSSDKITQLPGYTMWGRVYHVTLNETDPAKGGKLEIIAEGDSNPGHNLINPDNLCVTENYVYIQEDGDSYYKAAAHDSYIWQYSIATKKYVPWMNMNHRRFDQEWNAVYNTKNDNAFGVWEYGAMIDISDVVGVPNTFTLNIHPHTWLDAKFKNPDGGGSTNTEGGQTVLLHGVPR